MQILQPIVRESLLKKVLFWMTNNTIPNEHARFANFLFLNRSLSLSSGLPGTSRIEENTFFLHHPLFHRFNGRDKQVIHGDLLILLFPFISALDVQLGHTSLPLSLLRRGHQDNHQHHRGDAMFTFAKSS